VARVDARRGAEQEQGGRFRQAMWRTSNAPLRHGNAIGLLENGPAAYEDWLAAIGSARRWVHLENYIFADDSVGHRFADALCEKATRVVIQEPGRARVLRTLEVLLATADRRMWIADAYFLSAPTQALISAARDGVDVRILLPATNDVRWVGALSRAGYRPLLEAGVRIFEYGGPMMHAKTHVVDGRFSGGRPSRRTRERCSARAFSLACSGAAHSGKYHY
jgi:phosphatidylserine/phosphatidylglycerophosphate/cardiolipin synthase-like enzyme